MRVTCERHLFTSTAQAQGYALAGAGPALIGSARLREAVEAAAFRLSGLEPLRADNLVVLPVEELLLVGRVTPLPRDWSGRSGRYVALVTLPLAEVASLPTASVAPLLLSEALANALPAHEAVAPRLAAEGARRVELTSVTLEVETPAEERLRRLDLHEPLDAAMQLETEGRAVCPLPAQPLDFLLGVLLLHPRASRAKLGFGLGLRPPNATAGLGIALWLSTADAPAPPPADAETKRALSEARASFAQAAGAMAFYSSPDALDPGPRTIAEEVAALLEAERQRRASKALLPELLWELSAVDAARHLAAARQAAIRGLAGADVAQWTVNARRAFEPGKADPAWAVDILAELASRGETTPEAEALLPLALPALESAPEPALRRLFHALLASRSPDCRRILVEVPALAAFFAEALPLAESVSRGYESCVFAAGADPNEGTKLLPPGNDDAWKALFVDWLARGREGPAAAVLASRSGAATDPWSAEDVAALTRQAFRLHPRKNPPNLARALARLYRQEGQRVPRRERGAPPQLPPELQTVLDPDGQRLAPLAKGDQKRELRWVVWSGAGLAVLLSILGAWALLREPEAPVAELSPVEVEWQRFLEGMGPEEPPASPP